MSDALTRARKALNSRDLDWIRREVPPQYIDSPAVIRALLGAAAAGDPRLQDNANFRAATVALGELEQSRALSAQVSGLYHNAKLRELAGPSWDHYWQHPELAYEKLAALSAADPKQFRAIDGENVMRAIAGAREYARSNGLDTTAPAPAIPNGPALQDQEYRALVKASAERRLSTAEVERMTALKSAQLAREPTVPSGTPAEQAAHRKALGIKAPPTEYDKLIEKSPGGLSPGEHARMVELKGQQLVSEGKATQEDVSGQQESVDE
jgi:hypothetical protein